MAGTGSNRTQALVLLGHGSHYNADSSLPIYQQAAIIRSLGIFNEVHVSFWKEEPNLSRILNFVTSKDIYLVPYFMSEGYFTEQILPRELEISGKITEKSGKRVFYCSPIGIHPLMVEMIQAMVDSNIPDANSYPRNLVTVIVVGHGTSANENSRNSLIKCVRQLNIRRIYYEVLPAFMEEEPFDREILNQVRSPFVVVVPFFTSDGLHSREDIPTHMELIDNIKGELTKPVTKSIDGREIKIWYTASLGTEPSMTRVILNTVENVQRELPLLNTSSVDTTSYKKRLLNTINSVESISIGNVAIKKNEKGYRLFNKADSASSGLKEVAFDEIAIDLLARTNDAGKYRPLRSAPDLVRGWMISNISEDQLWIALEILQPGAIEQHFLALDEKLETCHFIELASRQSGIYKKIENLTEEQVKSLSQKICGMGCVQNPVWKFAKNSDAILEKPNPDFNIPCPEPCNWFLENARRIS